MFKTISLIVKEAIVEPIKNNVTSLLFWVGIAFILVGSLWGDVVDSWRFAPNGTGDSILKIGSAVLGAGVFAVIMKSAQFTDLFQRHIDEVFYNPQRFKSNAELNLKWKAITIAILKDVLPSTYSQTTDKIQRLFFDDETHFHFEDLEIKYAISVEADNDTVNIRNTLFARLIVSPKQENPQLEQQMNVGGACILTSLIVNDDELNIADVLVSDPDDPNNRRLKLDLKKYIKVEPDGTRAVKFERTINTTQRLADEPFIFARISRYIRGAVIKAKISEGYRLYFLNSGLSPRIPSIKDGDGYDRWMFGKADDLLLPGHAYTIMLIPQNKLKM